MAARKFHCDACGASVEFAPGAERLKCPYCGAEKTIPRSEAEIREHDLGAALERGFADAPTLQARALGCSACGASTRVDASVTATRCAFCDAPIVAPPTSQEVLAPQAILPFRFAAKEARDAFAGWLGSRWFAPSDLKRRARSEGLDGVYLPFFTFDADTETFYRGARGDHYYVEERYTAVEDGKTVEKTRRVRHTRWSHRSGTVFVNFDDVLVLASTGLPEPLVRKLEPWDLEALVPHDERYLSGFRAECDQLGLSSGFAAAKARCQPVIKEEIREDIGGDEQQIRSMETAWTRVTYKHVLLPAWIGAFRYGDRVYRVVVNARTGEVQGERPWSALKIAGAVLLAAAIAGLVALALVGQIGTPS